MESNINTSGEGSRPVTDGTVDNIGAAGNYPQGDTAGPSPKESASDKRSDADAARADDSAPFGLRQDAAPSSNKEKPPQVEDSAGQS